MNNIIDEILTRLYLECSRSISCLESEKTVASGHLVNFLVKIQQDSSLIRKQLNQGEPEK